MCGDGTRQQHARAAWILASLGLLVVWFAVWRHAPGTGLDLFPEPDATEYFAGAVRLAEQGDYSIHLAGERYPSRYPPGFSATVAPWILAGLEPAHAPFAANKLAAFLLLAVLFVGLWQQRNRLAAGLAVLVLATTPGFLLLARSPMADLTGGLLVTSSGWALLRYATSGRLRWGAAGSLLFGLALTVRVSNVLLGPLLAIAWLLGSWQGARPARRLFAHAWLLAAMAIAGVLPLLLYHAAEFGSPLANGYQYWLPDRGGLTAFGAEHLLPNARYLLRELLQLEWKTNCASFYGHGSYFGPALVVLVVLGLAWRPPTGTARWMALPAGLYGIAMLFYFFQDARFLLPLLPAAAAFVALRAQAALASANPRLRWFTICLLGLHALGIPGAGAAAETPTFLTESRSTPGSTPSPRYELLQRLRGEAPGLLLCSFSPPHAHAILGAPWTVCPATDEHGYRFSPARFRFGQQERRALVRAALAQKRPVYLLTDQGLRDLLAQTAAATGMAWEVLASRDQGGIAQLIRR